MNLSKSLLAMGFFLLMLFAAACTSTPTQQPTSLHITSIASRSPSTRSAWTITDKAAVQHLFQEMHNLPAHHNQGADSCGESPYHYDLTFFVGTKSIEQDGVYGYCGTITMADGNEYDPTDAFNKDFGRMIAEPPNSTPHP